MGHVGRQVLQRFLDDIHYRPMMGEIWMRSQWSTFKQVFFLGDTTTIRAVLMVASLWQSMSFMLPIHMIDRRFYTEMRFWPGQVWGLLFLVHAGLVWWRFRDHRNRKVVGYIVNGYGLSLWIWVCILESFVSPLSASMGMEWTMLAAAFGALIRTGDKEDRTSA